MARDLGSIETAERMARGAAVSGIGWLTASQRVSCACLFGPALPECVLHSFIPIQAPLQFSIPNRHEGGGGAAPFCLPRAARRCPVPARLNAFQQGNKSSRYFDCSPPPVRLCVGQAIGARNNRRGEGRSVDVDWWCFCFVSSLKCRGPRIVSVNRLV